MRTKAKTTETITFGFMVRSTLRIFIRFTAFTGTIIGATVSGVLNFQSTGRPQTVTIALFYTELARSTPLGIRSKSFG